MAAADASPPPTSKLRWGFLSTARINSKNVQAILESSTNVLVVRDADLTRNFDPLQGRCPEPRRTPCPTPPCTQGSLRRFPRSLLAPPRFLSPTQAVASRTKEKAEEWIAAHGAAAAGAKAYGSYEELLADADVDAVYIPVPTKPRTHWAIAAAEAGKHVLAEKPLAGDLRDAAAIVDACRRHGVQFMDGVMFMHHPRLARMRAVLDDVASFGPVRRLHSGFSFLGDEAFLAGDIRTQAELEPAGCLGDLGWYCIRFMLWACRWRAPTAVVAYAHEVSVSGVPTELSATLFFPDGVVAQFDCGFRTVFRQWARVEGTGASLFVDDFVIANRGRRSAFRVVRDTRLTDHDRSVAASDEEHAADTDEVQEVEMFRDFAACVAAIRAGGAPDPFWGRIALLTQAVTDACLASAAAAGSRVEVAAVPEL